MQDMELDDEAWNELLDATMHQAMLHGAVVVSATVG
jgi:hypothetical protein